jgi:hypothetical protein
MIRLRGYQDAQQAAITKRVRGRRREHEAHLETEFQNQVVRPLVDGTDHGSALATRFPRDNMDHVGWYLRTEPGIRGTAHVCILCSPRQPRPAFGKVLRLMMAATQPCGTCRRRLDEIDVPKGTK